MRWIQHGTLVGAALLATSASAQEPPPAGEGVLCLGTFIYFADDVGQRCRRGEDPEFQRRISGYVERFDAYITRNIVDGRQTLERFKEGQGVGVRGKDWLCTGDPVMMYDHFKQLKSEEMDKAVDELLARDGPPSFGDCV